MSEQMPGGLCRDCRNWNRWPPPPGSAREGYCNRIGFWWRKPARMVASPTGRGSFEVGDILLLTLPDFGCRCFEVKK